MAVHGQRQSNANLVRQQTTQGAKRIIGQL